MVEYKKFLTFVLILFLTACTSSGGRSDKGAGSIDISISPLQATVKVGQNVQLSGEAVDVFGAVLNVSESEFVWSTSNADIATVDQNGLVTGVLSGSVFIKLTYQEFSVEVRIFVSKTDIALVEIFPEPLEGDEGLKLFTGTILRLTPKISDADGDQISGIIPLWESVDDSIAVVSEDGVITAISVGNTTIKAHVGTITVSVTIIVTAYPVASIILEPKDFTLAINAIQQFNAEALDDNGVKIHYLKNEKFEWLSSDPEIASVDAFGEVTGKKEGTVFISAMYADVTSNVARLMVSGGRGSGDPASVTVSPESSTILIGNTTRLVARILNANDVQLDPELSETDNVNLIWRSDKDQIATVDSSGLVTGVAAGQATITATSGNVSASAEITVVTLEVSEVIVSPLVTDIETGSLQQLVAVAYNQIGEIVSNTAFEWSSSDHNVVDVSSSGMITALGVAGQLATITASTSNGIEGSAGVEIINTGGSAVTIDIAPDDTSVAVAESVQLSATVTGAANTTVIWSIDGGIANGTITVSGLYTAPALMPAGSVTVRAEAVADNTKTAISRITILPRFRKISTVDLLDKTPGSLALADFTGDGSVDMAIVSNAESRITVFEGTGSDFQQIGTPAELGIIVNGTGSYRIDTEDLDGDGNSDLISANSLNDTVSVLYGDGTGSFGAPVVLQFFDSTLPSVAITMNLFDGSPDIITGNLILDSLSILTNNNDRTFSGGIQVGLPDGAFPFYLATGDMNGDSVDDLMVADLTNDSIYIFHPDSSDGLVAGQSLTLEPGSHPVAIATSDFDNNGSVDIVSANRQSGNIALFMSTGSALSNSAMYYNAGVHPSDNAIGDFNHDGVSDIVVANRGSDTIGIFFGKGDGTFQDMVGFSTGSSPVNVEVADFDSDGWNDDIVTINLNGGSYTIFLN